MGLIAWFKRVQTDTKLDQIEQNLVKMLETIVWKFKDLPLRFYVKSCLGILQRPEFWCLRKYLACKCQKFKKIRNLELLKWSKRHFLGIKLIKIDFTYNCSCTSTLRTDVCQNRDSELLKLQKWQLFATSSFSKIDFT